MPLNPVKQRGSSRTYYYEGCEACDWELLVKNAARRLYHSGRINPFGGLVDIFYEDEYGTNIVAIQFRPMECGDEMRYPHTNVRIWDSEQWTTIHDYMIDRINERKEAHPSLDEHFAGHRPQVNDGTRHTGKFPPMDNMISQVFF